MPKNEQNNMSVRQNVTANTPVSYLGGTEFKFWPRNWLLFMCAA